MGWLKLLAWLPSSYLLTPWRSSFSKSQYSAHLKVSKLFYSWKKKKKKSTLPRKNVIHIEQWCCLKIFLSRYDITERDQENLLTGVCLKIFWVLVCANSCGKARWEALVLGNCTDSHLGYSACISLPQRFDLTCLEFERYMATLYTYMLFMYSFWPLKYFRRGTFFSLGEKVCLNN